MKPSLLVAILFFTAAACTPWEQPADVLYINGTIWTGDPDQPSASVLGIVKNTILYVGNDANLHRGKRTRIVDLRGKFVTPGFIDNHSHFLTGGFQLASVNLREAKTPKEFIQILADYAKGLPEGQWITGGDWDHEAWGGELPRREWIDSVTSRNPVFVNRLDGHMALANSLAIQLAAADKKMPDVEGGTIVRDAQGNPAGIFKDEAMALINGAIPAPSEQQLDAALQRAVDHYLSLGITQVHDVGSLGGWTDLKTYQRALNRNKLRLRIYAMIPLADWKKLAAYIAQNGKGDDKLRWGALKGFVDGSLGSTTAWFYDPYTDEPQTSGLLVTDTARLRTWIVRADSAGLQLAVHAIGDRANDWLLNTYATLDKQNGSRDRRFRVEHAQHLTRDGINAFARLGAIPSMQPYHAIDDGRWAEKRIGPERVKTTYAFRDLLQAGANLTFGSDWTVAPASPMEGMYAAVTRRTLDGKNRQGWVPAQKISAEAALRCYTVNNAYAAFHEKRTGKLKAGMLADFVVLSENILKVEPEKMRKAKVLRTVVGGKEMYVYQKK